MNHVVAAFPDRELHVVLENLNTHKKMRALAEETPQKSISILSHPIVMAQSNETWFSILQDQSLSGASFTTVADLRSTSMH